MPVMSLTLDRRTNIDGVPKAAELTEISGGYALEASDRAIMNMLYQHAHDSGRQADPTASRELPIVRQVDRRLDTVAPRYRPKSFVGPIAFAHSGKSNKS
jgi:hypothetical protein